jgi:hypothetical protein
VSNSPPNGQDEPEGPSGLDLPPDRPPHEGEMAALVRDGRPPSSALRSTAAFHAWLRQQPSTGRDREAIDQEIAAERAAWQ